MSSINHFVVIIQLELKNWFGNFYQWIISTWETHLGNCSQNKEDQLNLVLSQNRV